MVIYRLFKSLFLNMHTAMNFFIEFGTGVLVIGIFLLGKIIFNHFFDRDKNVPHKNP